MGKEVIHWSGRAYVDEPSITPEQYKMFFGKNEFGISFTTANSILKANRTQNDYSEVVPCDELNQETVNELIIAIMGGYTSGQIQHEGQTLCWCWDPRITNGDGCEIPLEKLPDEAKEDIAYNMLMNNYRCGEWSA